MMAMTATPRPSTFAGGGRAFTVNKVSRLKALKVKILTEKLI
jgi:hypothetical protein